jgi:hypothetical protein
MSKSKRKFLGRKSGKTKKWPKMTGKFLAIFSENRTIYILKNEIIEIICYLRLTDFH